MKKLGVFSLAVALMVVSVVPAFSADVTMYGRVLLETFYADGEATEGSYDANQARVATSGGDVEDFRFGLQANSRLGANFKATENLTGKIELGLKSSVALRHAYGIYHFGSGNLLVGQTDFPSDWGVPNVSSIDQGMNGYGSMGFDRMPQITVNMNNGLYVSLLEQLSGSGSDADGDVILPFLAVGFNNSFNGTAYGFGAGYGTYEKTSGMDADTYYVYGQIEQPIGVARVVAKVYYGQNMGEIPGYEGPEATYDAVADEDASTLAGFVAAKVKMNDNVNVMGGVGYAISDADDFAEKDDQMMVYLQAPIKIAEGFTITPNITLYDYMDDNAGADQGREIWAGAQWRMDF